MPAARTLDDRAAQHASAHGCPALARRHVKLDGRSGQQAIRGFDQRAARRYIEERRLPPRPHARAHDAVVVDRPTPAGAPPVRAFVA